MISVMIINLKSCAFKTWINTSWKLLVEIQELGESDSICSIFFSPGNLSPPPLIERLFKSWNSLSSHSVVLLILSPVSIAFFCQKNLNLFFFVKLWAEGQKLGALAFTQFFFANRARAFYVWFYLAIFACWKSLKAILFQYIQKVQLESVWFQLFIFFIPSMLKLKSYQPKTIIILSLSSLQCTNVATQWLCVAY